MMNLRHTRSSEALERKGNELKSGSGRKWNMMSVQGPLPSEDTARQYFRIETNAAETLFVYRGKGEKGMRRLYLLAVIAGGAGIAGEKPEPTWV